MESVRRGFDAMAMNMKQAVSMDELLHRLAIVDRVELVDGIFVEIDVMTAGYLHIHIIGNLYDLMHLYVTKHRLGLYGGDGLTFILEVTNEGIRRTRIPDSFFIKKSRIPKDWDISKPFPAAPDLAIEVISPNRDMTELQERIDDYFHYGASQVWVLYPAGKSLHQYVDYKTIHIHRIEDSFTASDLFPDLLIEIAQCFKIDLPSAEE
jgi:Uma2 family endonuclease